LVVQAFDARAGHHDGWYIFGHYLLVTKDRELFKPSTDSGSLVVSIKNKFLLVLGVGFFVVDVTDEVVFTFLANVTWPWVLLQLLRWCCVDCVIRHERDVREE